MRRHPAKRDANEEAIVEALRALGASIAPLRGKGLPDLLVAHNGRVWLCEVKQRKGTLTKAQVEWHAAWRGPQPVILRTVDDAVQLLRNHA